MLKFPFNFSHAEISIKVYHKLDPGDVLMVNVEYVYGKQSLLSEQFLFWFTCRIQSHFGGSVVRCSRSSEERSRRHSG